MNRDDLKKYRETEEWIEGRMETIERLRTQAEKITSTLSDMPRGTPKIQDRMAEYTSEMIDYVEELAAKIIEHQRDQQRILQQIENMKNPLYRNILEAKYIRGLTLEDIASQKNYNYDHIRRLNGWALNEFDKGELN